MIDKSQDSRDTVNTKNKTCLHYSKLVNFTKQTEMLIGKSQDVGLRLKECIELVLFHSRLVNFFKTIRAVDT